MRGVLSAIWHTWKAIGLKIGNLIARVILTIFYLTVFVPYGVVVQLEKVRRTGWDGRESLWLERSNPATTLDATRKLY